MSDTDRRFTLDVSGLPSVVFGSRAPLWWGVAGMIAIEGTMFAILLASYFYLRGNSAEWPPPGTLHPPLALTTANLLVLLASVWPMHRVNHYAARYDLGGIGRWLVITVLLSLTSLVLRGYEMAGLNFRWDSHAYGSVVWVALGLHTFHLLTSNLENLLFLVLLARGPVEDKHMLDVQVNGMYWFFVVVSWIPFYAVIFLDPGLFRP